MKPSKYIRLLPLALALGITGAHAAGDAKPCECIGNRDDARTQGRDADVVGAKELPHDEHGRDVDDADDDTRGAEPLESPLQLLGGFVHGCQSVRAAQIRRCNHTREARGLKRIWRLLDTEDPAVDGDGDLCTIVPGVLASALDAARAQVVS